MSGWTPHMLADRPARGLVTFRLVSDGRPRRYVQLIVPTATAVDTAGHREVWMRLAEAARGADGRDPAP